MIEGSGSITSDKFIKLKKLCLTLAAKIENNNQLGVIQFGSSAVIVASLTGDIPLIKAKVRGK